jgi:hypothetical protein
MRSFVLVLIAGCYAGHFATITGPFVGTRVSVGCLDVAIALTEDDLAPSPIISYELGNSCFHETMVDFSAVHVVATTADGRQLVLSPFDPRGELKPLQLDAWTAGDERIAYRSDDAFVPTTVCVDLGRLDANHPTDPQWRCLAAGGVR